MPDLAYYTGLITSQHNTKPKFMATVAALVQPLVDTQVCIAQIPSDFDIDHAVGVQLDIVGLWVGVSRIINSLSGQFLLSDDTYRILLKTRIAANHWDGTMEGITNILSILFAGYDIFVIDNFDMSMVVGIFNLAPDSELMSVFLGGYVPLKPVGVRVNYAFNPIFGLDYENNYIAGLDVGYLI